MTDQTPLADIDQTAAVRLAAAVAVQAVKDLHDKDLVTALDALAWFLDDESAAWLGALGLPDDPAVILRSVATSGTPKLSTFATR